MSIFADKVSRELYDSERDRRIVAEAREVSQHDQIALLKECLVKAEERERDAVEREQSALDRERTLLEQLSQAKFESEQRPPSNSQPTAADIMRIPAHTKHAREARLSAAVHAASNGKNGDFADLTAEQKLEVKQAVADAAGTKP